MSQSIIQLDVVTSSSAQAEEDDNNSIYTQTLFFHHGVYQIIRVHGSRLNPAVRKDNGRRAIDAKFASQFYIVIHSRRSAFGRRARLSLSKESSRSASDFSQTIALALS